LEFSNCFPGAYGIRYGADGKVWNAKNLIVNCPSEINELQISSPSPIKSMVAVICKSTNGDVDKPYLVDGLSGRVWSLKLGGGVAPWTSWSPQDAYALFVSGAEGGPAAEPKPRRSNLQAFMIP
jgi:hypothetical protein